MSETIVDNTLTPRQAEEAVLCALFGRTGRMTEIATRLTPEMFQTPELALIYRAMTALYKRGIEPDMIATQAEMQRLDPRQCTSQKGLRPIMGSMAIVRHDDNLAVYVDEVRRNALLRQLTLLFENLRLKAQEGSTDGNELIVKAEQALIGLREQQHLGVPARLLTDLAAEVIDEHRRRADSPQTAHGVLSGLDDFDRITGGMHPGELFVEAGRPGDGKSAVALHIAYQAALAGQRSLLFSLEMTYRQILDRFFTGYAGVAAGTLRRGTLTPEDYERMEAFRDQTRQINLFINYSATNQLEQIRSEVLLQKKRAGCDLVIIDYLHLLDLRPAHKETLEQVIARHVRRIKALAVEAECPVLLLSQMNRNSEIRSDKSHMPILSDLRDSGTIEQVADCVFFVYRPDRHGITVDPQTGENLQNIGKLVVAKNRNGTTGIASFRFNNSFTRLENQIPADLWK